MYNKMAKNEPFFGLFSLYFKTKCSQRRRFYAQKDSRKNRCFGGFLLRNLAKKGNGSWMMDLLQFIEII